jgi:Protein of unknown function (DUF3313)
MRYVGLVLGLSVVLASTLTQAAQDVTEDGLVRVPSSQRISVYRAPEVPFHRYQRIVIAPIPVVFRKTWMRDNHEMKPQEIDRLKEEFAQAFREELVEELVERGGYELAETVGPDTLRVEPYVLNVNIVAPHASSEARAHTYLRTGNSMKVAIELRDAASTVIVGRIINVVQPQEWTVPQFASKVSNLGEMRSRFADSARYTREALNVASAVRE